MDEGTLPGKLVTVGSSHEVGARDRTKTPRFSLRQRLLLLTFTALLPAFVILIAGQASYRATRSAEVDSYASHMADVVLTEVIRGMTGAATMMVAAGRSMLLDPSHPDHCADYFGGLMHDFPSLLDMAIAGPDRKIICMKGVSSAAVMQEGIDEVAAKSSPGIVIGSYRPTSSGPALPIGMALRSAAGDVQGYMELSAGVADLQKLVVGASIPASSSTIVTDGNGIVLLSVPDSMLSPGDKIPEGLQQYVFAKQRGAVRGPDTSGHPSIIGYRPSIEQFPMAVIFMLPEAPMMAPVNRDALIFTTIALAGGALASALAWFIGSRYIAAPVQAVYGAVSARRAGDKAARTGMVNDGSELGAIGNATDALFDELDRREELQAKAEQQRDLYAREVQHRVKNLLAVIQVVARQTLNRGESAPEIKAFEGRIDAIVRANAKLLAEHESSGTLEALLRETTAPFLNGYPDRFLITGPELMLRSKPALAIAMAVHELCTNAVKYGALSSPGGYVKIQWSVVRDSLELSWIERGGPTVSTPTKEGFGSMLITRALEGETRGTVRVCYATDGFELHLSAPSAQLIP